MGKANATEVGEIYTVDNPSACPDHAEPHKYKFAMLLQFESSEDIRQAMKDGRVEFTTFGG